MNEIQPVHVDESGYPYYFGSKENPFNCRVINEPMRSLEQIRLIADGGVIVNELKSRKPISHDEDKIRIIEENLSLRERISPLLGKLHLETSDLQTPLEDHRAA